MTALPTRLRNVLDVYERMSTTYGFEVAADALLLDAAPELLTEALRRCDPGDTDIERLVKWLRESWDSEPLPHFHAAADLIEQAFGDPR